ncbi:MAG: hypothetical protein ACTHMV_09980 [Chitinophagaceae bacterium]
MKKVIAAFDNGHYSEGMMQFASELNKKEPILLVGAFLPQVDYASLWSYAAANIADGVYIPLIEPQTAEAIQKTIDRFETYCLKNHIRFTVHKEYFDFALPELKKETIYADLLLIGSDLFYSQTGIDLNDYLKEILHHTDCPVLIIPEKSDFPANNILTCDGKEGSIYAIKQFAYLFPELASQPTTLVYANPDPDHQIPGHGYVMELVNCHYPRLDEVHLAADGKNFFGTWVSGIKSPVVIAGAFNRGDISMIFKKSFITDTIASHRLPVFIAHK